MKKSTLLIKLVHCPLSGEKHVKTLEKMNFMVSWKPYPIPYAFNTKKYAENN